MENVKELLTNALNPQARLMQETRGLVSKWDKTGLLEGLKSDIEKSNMSVLLESQAKQLIEEASVTGTQSNSEQWAGVALPLVRRVFAEIAAKEFVSVQPMNLPSGLVFYLDFKYGTTSGAFTADSSTNYSSLFGGTGIKSGSTDAPVGGLYGPGRFGYTVNDQNAWCTYSSASATVSDINFDTGNSNDPVGSSISASLVAGKLTVVTTTNLSSVIASASGSYPDFNGVRSFVPFFGQRYSSSLNLQYFPGFTKTNGTEVSFVVSGSLSSIAGYFTDSGSMNVVLSLQPKKFN
jgi:hypothetical protein